MRTREAEAVESISADLSTSAHSSHEGRLLRLARLLITVRPNASAVAVGIFIFTATIMLMYRPASQPVMGDSAVYDYIAQSILRGQVPYRDVVDIKGPGSTYLSAFAIWAGRSASVRDVIAVRILQILLASALAVLIYRIAEIALCSRIGGAIAAVVPLLTPAWNEWTVSGTQPKLSMMLFGMLTLLLVAQRAPFWAGFCSMIACLCWQPGLLFTGIAFLMFTKYFTCWRDLRWMRVLAGASVPLAIVVGYFGLRGALADMWAWTISYNLTVFGPDANEAPRQAFAHIWRVSKRIFGFDMPLVGMSLLGLLIYAARQIITRFRNRQLDEAASLKDSIIIGPVVYFLFTIINFQSGPDLIPFIPFIGVFAASFLLDVWRALSSTVPFARKLAANEIPLLSGAMLLLLVVIVFIRAATFTIPPGITLREQDKQFKTIAQLLGPNDTIYVHGIVELLVVLNRPNLNPYVLLDWHADRFAADRRHTDFSAIVAEMEAAKPKLVALARLRTLENRRLLEEWVAQHYEKLPDFNYHNVYIRKGD